MGEKDTNIQQRKNFYNYVNEYDVRRGTNFLNTFPELENFYKLCKNA